MAEEKKSKYFRNGEKQKSKYSADNKAKSKYIRSKDDEAEKEIGEIKDENSPKDEYRKNVITPKRAREMMLKEEAEETEVEIPEIETPEEPEPEENLLEVFDDFAERKGTDTDLVKEKKADRSQMRSYRKKSKEDSNREKRKEAKVREFLCVMVLSVVAVGLFFLKIRIPFVPRMFSVEFSTIPELMVSIAYGPLIGALIVVIKNLIHMAIVPSYAISDLTNIMLDSVFIIIAGLLYSRSMFRGDKKVSGHKNANKKGYRRKRIFVSSLTGALISLVPQFLITRYIAFPLIEKFYGDKGVTMASILASYQNSMTGLKNFLPDAVSRFLPEITSISKGILFFNMPVTFGKLFISTVVVALTYKYVSPFLHYRKKKSKKHKKK